MLRGRVVERRLAVGNREHLVPLEAERTPESLANVRFVVDDEDVERGPGTHASQATGPSPPPCLQACPPMRRPPFRRLIRRGLSGFATGAVALAVPLAVASGPTGGSAPAPGSCDNAVTPGVFSFSVPSQGSMRSATVHVPPAARGGSPLPLLLALHGVGGNGRFMAHYTGLSKLGDRAGFVVAYPSALGSLPRWNLGGAAITCA